jgi:hypothetical protein
MPFHTDLFNRMDIYTENINIYYFDIINNLKNFGETMPTNAKITIELPEGVSKEEILKEIENLIRLKKYEVDMSFNLLNDYDKKRALKIAEFVENYLKNHYPKVKFKIRLEYDDFEDEIIVCVNFKTKLSSEDRLKIIEEVSDAVRNAYPKSERKGILITYF